MKTCRSVSILLFTLIFCSCQIRTSKPAGEPEYKRMIRISDSLQVIKDTHRTDSIYQLYHREGYRNCGCPAGLPQGQHIQSLIDDAMEGDEQSVACLWDIYFFSTSFTTADPQKAYDIYMLAKRINPSLNICDENEKLSAIKKCLEAGPFDAKRFMIAYGIKKDFESDDHHPLAVWDIARTLSIGRRYGKADPKLVFQVICRGGTYSGNLIKAVDSFYLHWKHNEHAVFEPKDYIGMYIGNAFPAVIAERGSDEDKEWQIRDLSSSLKNNAGVYLPGAYRCARKFFEAYADEEEGNGGSGIGAWEIYSIMEQEDSFLHMIDMISHDSLPQPLIGDSTSDKRLNAIYRNTLIYLHNKSFNMALSEDGVRMTEKAWIPYRDSTSHLLSIARPEISESSWKNWLSEKRIEQLKRTLMLAKQYNTSG